MLNWVSVYQTAPYMHRSLNNQFAMLMTQPLCFMASILSLFLRFIVRLGIMQPYIELRRLGA